jgi:excisionase family DNA binding protein
MLQMTNLGTLFNLKHLHKKFGISVRTWREYIKRKELRAFKIGRTYHVFEQDLLEFIKDNEVYTWRKQGAYPFDG